MTSAAMYQAGVSANKMKYEGVLSELAVQDHSALAEWIEDELEPGSAATMIGVVELDVVRVISEFRRFARVEKVKFTVIKSTKRRAIFGANMINMLDAQDEDCPDPLQSDYDYDERKQSHELLGSII